jgi:hypothetical protein
MSSNLILGLLNINPTPFVQKDENLFLKDENISIEVVLPFFATRSFTFNGI